METTAEWLVDLILETSDSAQGPLRQIVAALPGRVPTGTNRSGTPESREISVESLLQDSLEDRLTAPVIFESDASASLRGILQDDALALALDQSRLRESMLEARSEGHNP